MRSDIDRFWDKIIKTDTCWVWTGATTDYGHGRFVVATHIHERAHRFSWQIHFGNIPDGIKVCHKCDNPPCVNPEHLFLGTQKDNIRDMMQKGRMIKPPHSYGERHHKTKFDLETARKISQDKRTGKEIAKEYGICVETVYRLRRGETWKQIC